MNNEVTNLIEESNKEQIKDYSEDYTDLIDIPPDEVMLTTMDNPFNPKLNYEQWRQWDIQNDYFTEALVARIADIPDEMEDPVSVGNKILDAMISIAENDAQGIYKLI